MEDFLKSAGLALDRSHNPEQPVELATSSVFFLRDDLLRLVDSTTDVSLKLLMLHIILSMVRVLQSGGNVHSLSFTEALVLLESLRGRNYPLLPIILM